ncbi:P-loop containing nucleoside triphosphate hydrolase protein [Aspergillus avenaceus]|uniref:ATP-dependent RNA helicase n=1 Tax=Aspergillus avenaceus TaxID=36643 RepID=A0A5N6TE61_ASPAV|nr:P-loop containing nucleoside triphosphate hydrolase protein [Aspergillus avenaceus]
MLGAFRRNGVAHALRAASAPRVLRVTPQRLQWLPSSSPAISHVPRSSFHLSSTTFAAAEAQLQSDGIASKPVELSQFKQLGEHGLVNFKVIRNITDNMGLETMTDVQRMTINPALKGDDLLAQAKTGTGKTVAFLLPVIHNILKDESISKGSWRNRSFASAEDIRAIVISPTRELAEQIAEEAKKLTFNTGVVVQTAVGGTRKMEGLRRIQRQGCHLLVGTPGRLKDILSDSRHGIKAPNLTSFVLDEADRLLDDGFAPDIAEIQGLLPDPAKVDRQTLMFSATVPKEVRAMVRHTMKPDFKAVRTVRDDEVPTHLTVPQKRVMVDGFQNLMPALLELAKKGVTESTERPFKAIVYFNSTALTKMTHDLFNELLNDPEDPRSGHPLRGVQFIEMHSRLTQAARTRHSDLFRRCRSAILFSSDVTSRGLDFPDVTHVIQIGAARGRDSYIHRLGRTGRANKSGEGWCLYHPNEEHFFQRHLGDLPVELDNSLATASLCMDKPLPSNASPEAVKMIEQVQGAMRDVPEETRADAWRSMFGSVSQIFKNPKALVAALNDLATHGFNLQEIPPISSSLARQLGIDRLSEVNLFRSGNNYRRDDSRSERTSGSTGPSWSGRGYKGSKRQFNNNFNGRDNYSKRDSFGGRSNSFRDSRFQSRY